MSLTAYIQVGENRYRERYGLDFEDFEVGQRFQHRPGLTVSQQANANEALDTQNAAQLHYDSHYASKTEWGKCLVVSTLTLQYILGLSSKTFGKKYRLTGFDDITMTGPVFEGDTLYAGSEILDKADYAPDPDLGLITVRSTGINQKGLKVVSLTYRLLIFKRGRHPLDLINPPAYQGYPTGARFSLYRTMPDDSLMEQVGMFYEDFKEGETFEHRPAKTITAEDTRLHSLHSLEWNPQYHDYAYNAALNGGKLLINEAYLLGAMAALSTRTFGRVVANLGWTGVELPGPVFAPVTLYAESTVLGKRESASRPTQGIMEVETRGNTAENDLVCSYRRRLLIYKKNLGPYEAAGY
jgi:itaconyl-CoA hydratase